jgi:hypothetical protein
MLPFMHCFGGDSSLMMGLHCGLAFTVQTFRWEPFQPAMHPQFPIPRPRRALCVVNGNGCVEFHLKVHYAKKKIVTLNM